MILAALVIGYLPGAFLYRLPIGQRDRRAALAADERVFWHVLLSLSWSLAVVLTLAWIGWYRFDRLIAINGALCATLLLVGRGGLRYGGSTARPSWTVALPIVLIALGLWRFFPSSEYVIGGKDPGVYMNEGIQIAQRGTLVIRDPVVAAVPEETARDLFFPSHYQSDYYSNRFMGFFLQDPRTGAVVGQFPHLYPASIAIGYGLNGLSGARMAVGVWAMLGLAAVYFVGARFLGRAAAFAAAALLSLNVVEVFFGRYPNAEVALQALGFAMLLAFARAHQDDDPFFGPVAGVLGGALLFTRIEGALLLAAVVVAAALCWIVERKRPRAGFVLALVVCGIGAVTYLMGPMRAYIAVPQLYAGRIPLARSAVAVAALVACAALAFWLRRMPIARARALVSWTVVLILLSTAAYAWFLRLPLRSPDSKLALHDATALRTYTDFYLLRPGLIAALIGLAVAARRFWRDPALVLTIGAFALFFFYKIHIVPEHFWAARRILPVILPGALLLAAAAATGPPEAARRWLSTAWLAAGAIVLAFLGVRYATAAAPVLSHVEYRDIIPHLESLASRFSARDLVLIESRNASDTHVLAVPLAYIYAVPVLVLNNPKPDKLALRTFLEDAGKTYSRVFFVGGGGTDLLSRRIVATPIAGEKIQVDEYAATPWDTYPSGIRKKEFDYSVYQLTVGDSATGPFALDVGFQDDLNVLRFYAKETTEGRTIRWTGPQSFVTVPGLTGAEREVVLVMHDGGRPAQAPPAHVQVFFNDVLLGSVAVTPGFQPYRFALPADVAAVAGRMDDPAQLKLISTVWNPHEVNGGPDNRNLGVMVDRVEVH